MRTLLEDAVDLMREKGAEYADIRFEDFTTNMLEVKDRRVEEISSGEDRGVGIRAFYKGAWGFASTNDLDELEMTAEKAVRSAKALQKHSKIEEYELQERETVEETLSSRADIPPGNMRMEQKLALLEDAERTMRYHSEKVKTARVVYSDAEGRYVFVNSEGSFIEKKPTHYSLYCFATARENDRVETHLERSASINGLEHFQDADPVRMGEKAAAMAEEIVNAPRPPSGRMPVIIGDTLGGLFAHEAVGHGAEADTVLSGNSMFAGKRGEQIGSEEVTVIDDPTLEGKHGSYRYDDEGTKARRTTIIEEGRLNGLLHSRETSSREGVRPTGNGRSQSFSHRPVVRMSNTFFDEGGYTKEEMVESVEEGLYLKGFKGGQVSTAEGNFTFGTTHAYLIEDGEITDIVRGPSISGLTLQVLDNIEMVAKDREIGDPGFCGKDGQTVYVDTGSPHMKVTELTVG